MHGKLFNIFVFFFFGNLPALWQRLLALGQDMEVFKEAWIGQVKLETSLFFSNLECLCDLVYSLSC